MFARAVVSSLFACKTAKNRDPDASLFQQIDTEDACRDGQKTFSSLQFQPNITQTKDSQAVEQYEAL